MHLCAKEKRIETQGAGIQCEIFQGNLIITTVILQLNKLNTGYEEQTLFVSCVQLTVHGRFEAERSKRGRGPKRATKVKTSVISIWNFYLTSVQRLYSRKEE
jgi:hypothetical protein